MSEKAKILVIEDDLYTRDLYIEVLNGAGYEVVAAVDGEEGVLKASEGGYNLILLDVMMPKMNGLEVLKALKEKPPQKQNGPVVLLTNLAHDPVIKEALELGAKNYLIKSDMDPAQLLNKIKSYL